MPYGRVQGLARSWDFIYVDPELRSHVTIDSAMFNKADQQLDPETLPDFKEMRIENSSVTFKRDAHIWLALRLTSSVTEDLVVRHPVTLAKSISIYEVNGQSLRPIGKSLPDQLSVQI